MNKERLKEIKQRQQELFLFITNIGGVNIPENSSQVNQLMYCFIMLREIIQELVQELEKYVKE